MSASRFPHSTDFFSALAAGSSLSLLDSASTGNGIDDVTRLPLAAGVPPVSETEPTTHDAVLMRKPSLQQCCLLPNNFGHCYYYYYFLQCLRPLTEWQEKHPTVAVAAFSNGSLFRRGLTWRNSKNVKNQKPTSPSVVIVFAAAEAAKWFWVIFSLTSWSRWTCKMAFSIFVHVSVTIQIWKMTYSVV